MGGGEGGGEGGGSIRRISYLLGRLVRARTLCTSTKEIKKTFAPQIRENIDWRWPLTCVHSIMMVFSSQLAEGGGTRPDPFHAI
jgi:hypothetical protein